MCLAQSSYQQAKENLKTEIESLIAEQDLDIIEAARLLIIKLKYQKNVTKNS